MARVFQRTALAVLAVYVASSVAGGIVVMEGALHLQRRPVSDGGAFAASQAHWTSGGVSDVSVTAADGAVLRGWYMRPANWNGDSVILLHGVGDNREGVESYASMLLKDGYVVLVPDSRGHGESDGELVTYGLLESDDLRRWSLWRARRDTQASGAGLGGCTYLVGESMGAALALQATTTVPGLCAVVAEASFASFREIGFERIAQRLRWKIGVSHVLAWPMVEAAFVYARMRYGLDFEQASPERKLASSGVPALLIAGLEDRNIPLRHSERILKVAGGGTELWRVAGAGHTEAASVDPREFERRLLAWFQGHRHVTGVSRLATGL